MGACYCMRGRHCVICIHPDLRQIEDVLTAGGKLVPTAQRFNVAKSSLARHRANCLAPKAAAAARLVQGGNEAVGRAKAILRGDAPSTSDVLNLTSLLDRIGRSLDRLEQSAVAASSDGLHNALASLSGQISRSVETAARMQNIGYKDATPANQGERFGITIVLPSLADNPPVTIDCTSERGSESEPEPAPRVPARRRNFAVGFSLPEENEESGD